MVIGVIVFIASAALRCEALFLTPARRLHTDGMRKSLWRDSPESFRGWRRGELNPCPRRYPRRHLHVYPALRFKEPTLHRRTAVSRASTKFLHLPARSLRRKISLLSTFGAVAGVQLQTSRSIKPRERDLGDLRLFVLARFLTRPTNHPRHAACASNHKSKPVRPHF